MEASKDISRLIEIMEALRQPETGCPWDVVQTFETIKPYTIEEAYEVADAIERKDMDDLCEELGDLLLQVVFHARIAEELGEFAFGDVVHAVTSKMIRRHPHVFAVSDADTPDGVKLQWDRIKAEEKRERAERRARRGITEDFKAGFLGSVQRSQPALTEALKLQEQAARAGFDWSNPAPILDKIEEEIAELREALAEGKPEKVSDELGDLILRSSISAGMSKPIRKMRCAVRTRNSADVSITSKRHSRKMAKRWKRRASREWKISGRRRNASNVRLIRFRPSPPSPRI